MDPHFEVRYRSSFRWRSVSGILCALAFAVPLTAVFFWSLLDPGRRGSVADEVAVALISLSCWGLVGFFATALATRRKSIRHGEAALTAGPRGLTFPDWRGRTIVLPWSDIDSFHILRTRGENRLFVEGRYKDAAGHPVTFDVEDFEMDPETLLGELRRILDMMAGADGPEPTSRPSATSGEGAAKVVVDGATSAPSPLDAFLKPMLGLPAWGVKQGHGSFLTFEFGAARQEVRERQSDGKAARRSAYVQGEWHLWIYCCHRRAFQDGKQLAWSEDANEVIECAAASLNGQKLLAVTVDPERGVSSFAFDRGGSLETWPYGDDAAEEQWTILTDTEAFAYRADGLYQRGPADTPPDQIRWLPLR